MAKLVSPIRWTIFLFIGLPFQFLVYALYPFIHLYWRFFVFKEVDVLAKAVHIHPANLDDRFYKIRDNCFHDNEDDHSAFTHFGLFIESSDFAIAGLTKLIHEDGRFLRRFYHGVQEGWYTSGDCVANWSFAYAVSDVRLPEVVRRAATHYLKNLGTKSLTEPVDWVSDRCNNFGINYCPDSQVVKLGQPAAGPQFYTTSALLALAYRELGGIWKPIFWVHWLLLGGWFWCWSPMLYTKTWKGWYVRETTMKCLFTLLTVFGNRWWIRFPMRFISKKIAETENHLFTAMMAQALPPLPGVMDPFFSQQPDAVSRPTEPKTNAWVPKGLVAIREKALKLW